MTTAPDRKGGENDRFVKEEEEEQVRSMSRLVSLCDQKERGHLIILIKHGFINMIKIYIIWFVN